MEHFCVNIIPLSDPDNCLITTFAIMNSMTITNKTSRQKKVRKPVAIPPMPDYNARVLAYLASAAVIISGILVGHFSQDLIWLIPMAMLWPHLLYFTVRFLNKQRNPIVRNKLLLIDSVILGPMLVFIDFSIVPTLLFILMLNFSFINVGGMKSWLYGNLAWLTSLCLSSLYFGIKLAPSTPAVVSIVSVISIGAYICVTAYYTHQQAKALVHAKSLI